MRWAVSPLLALALLSVPAPAQQPVPGQAAAQPKLYNTVKQKLLKGKQIFSLTRRGFTNLARPAGRADVAGGAPGPRRA
jgi:hypothetical protein